MIVSMLIGSTSLELFLAAVLALAVLFIAALAIASFCSQRPTELGPVDGFLRDCPDTRNCVCSQATRADQRIAPIEFAGSAKEALTKLKTIVAKLRGGLFDGSVIAGESENYLHVECTSRLFRFIDDLEFLVDTQRGVIHCRSASRWGRFDFGVNRRRIETIRRALRTDEANQTRP